MITETNSYTMGRDISSLSTAISTQRVDFTALLRNVVELEFGVRAATSAIEENKSANAILTGELTELRVIVHNLTKGVADVTSYMRALSVDVDKLTHAVADIRETNILTGASS